jgi:hypothetical protein
MWDLEKHTCERLRNSIMLLGLDLFPVDQIINMVVNGFSRRVATHDKNLLIWMNHWLCWIPDTGLHIGEPLYYESIFLQNALFKDLQN